MSPATKERSRQSAFLHAVEMMGLDSAGLSKAVGPLATTPNDTIYSQGTLKLHHYRPMVDTVYRVPVLIVTSLVNQPYVLDLVPGQSMVEHLLRQGYDVYLIEWGRPRREHKDLVLEDYVLDRLPNCLKQVQVDSGVAAVSVIGYCVGGMLAAMYAARVSGSKQSGPLKNLVCMATPVNSDGLESLKAWMGADFDEEKLLAEFGNVPGDFVQTALRALRPYGKLAGAMSTLNNIANPEAVQSTLRMTKWETDNLPFPGGVFRQMVKSFLQENRLVKGTWSIGGARVNLGDIRVPFLHLLAQDDHITPYTSSSDLCCLVGSRDKQELVLKGGHVGLVAGRGAQTRMWPALDAWLATRSL